MQKEILNKDFFDAAADAQFSCISARENAKFKALFGEPEPVLSSGADVQGEKMKKTN